MPQSQSLPLESIGTPVSIQTAFSTTIRTHTGSARSIGVIGLEAHLQLLTSPLKVDKFCPSREKLSQMSCMYLFTCPAKEAEKSPQLHAACIPEQTPIVFGREICMCLQQEWD